VFSLFFFPSFFFFLLLSSFFLFFLHLHFFSSSFLLYFLSSYSFFFFRFFHFFFYFYFLLVRHSGPCLPPLPPCSPYAGCIPTSTSNLVSSTSTLNKLHCYATSTPTTSHHPPPLHITPTCYTTLHPCCTSKLYHHPCMLNHLYSMLHHLFSMLCLHA
jgi:hypothetical protein